MKEKGYVYILTNPSFREDWVKIGKSSRPVDVRSKELDNTAVPLPFEIYATVKSSKYSYIESSLHKILTDLADKRIRKNREFFNMKPEEAFRYLKLIAEMDENAEINAPEDEPNSSGGDSVHSKSYTHLGNCTVETDDIFYLSNGVAEGKMRVQNGCEYVVLEGSILDPKITSNESSIRKSRKEHADSLSEDGMVVVRDITFNTPSGAANFIRGGACNGKTYWRTASDRPLSEFILYHKNSSDN